MSTLHSQYIVPASPSTKIRLSLLATALVDALGGPAEFKRRFSFKTITSMIPSRNFNLPKGVWTDDTSMALCLARSIASSRLRGVEDGFDEHDQLNAYINWWSGGELSAIGRCFDIGGTISRALTIYSPYVDAKDSTARAEGLRKIKAELDHEMCSGNGSLMRVLPIGLAYWQSEEKARLYARQSSMTTHPNELCQEACEVWIGAIAKMMQVACTSSTESGKSFSKLDLLEYFSTFPYQNEALRQALAVPHLEFPGSISISDRDSQLELYYRANHPILKLIVNTVAENAKAKRPDLPIPTEKDLSSSGYVLHTLVAALYCFFASSTFEEGAILAVNLGNDADTVGAVYAGLAGVWYAGNNELSSSVSVGGGKKESSEKFWSERVKEWQKDLVKRELVEEVAEELVKFNSDFKSA